MISKKTSSIIGFTMMWLLAIAFLLVGCMAVVEGPLVGPSEDATSSASELGTTLTLGRIGLKVDPKSGTVSQLTLDLAGNTAGIRLLPVIINDNFDFMAASCPDCGPVPGCNEESPGTRYVEVELVVSAGSSLANIEIVNETTSTAGVVSKIPSTTLAGPLMPGDPFNPQVTLDLADCNPFNVFFDLQGDIGAGSPLTTLQEVVLPAGFDPADLIIAPSSLPFPGVIDNLYVPIGNITDISLLTGPVDFGAGFAEIRYSYDRNALLAAGLREIFQVFFYDPVDGTWKEVDDVVVDTVNEEIIAYTSHLTPFLPVGVPVGSDIVFVDIVNGNDANPGTETQPLQTIQAGINLANTLYTTAAVFVAEGTNNVDYGSGTHVVMQEGISIYGGFKSDWSVQDPDTYTTTILDTTSSGGTLLGDPNSTIVAGTGISNATIIDGFTLNGGGGDYSAAIYNNGGSPTIQNNIIDGGSGNSFSHGILSKGASSSPVIQNNTISGGSGNTDTSGITNLASSPTIQDNLIEGGSGSNGSHGILEQGTASLIQRNTVGGGNGGNHSNGIRIINPSTAPTVINNTVYGGTAPTSRGLSIGDSSSPIARNNTVGGGSGSSTVYGIYIASSASPVIENNIVFTSGSGPNRYCVFEAGANPSFLRNNNLDSCPTALYRDGDGSGNLTTITAVNGLTDITSSGNISSAPQFVDINGADNDISTVEDNDWRLTSSTHVNVRQGGLDLSASFTTDKAGNTRTADTSESPTNTGAAGWSMGAYEFDLGFSGTTEIMLTASDGADSDFFGESVSISGNTIVVGAPDDDVGINNNQGSAYVFVRSANTWSFQQKLTASDGAANDFFGESVSIDGDTIVVGAYRDKVGSNNRQGSAYVFVRSANTWSFQQKLTASDGAVADWFGESVSIDGDTIVVGAREDDVGSNNNQGSAYVFVRSTNTWSQQQRLTASDGAANDFFGESVSISGDTIVVGARDDKVGSNNKQGSAYVFMRSTNTWSFQQKLTADDGAELDHFGESVSISGDTIVVGANSDKVGSNTNQGSAYVFMRSATTWSQQQRLTAIDGEAVDYFGWSVSIDINTIVVGAYRDDVGSNNRQGSAYVFVRSANTWSFQQKLAADDGAALDHFGESVSISGDTIVVGANFDDVGINNDQGSAYVFQ